jgi:hypothetical protein
LCHVFFGSQANTIDWSIMRLEGAAVVSGDNRISVTAGWIIGVHRDRRKSKGEVRVGDSARRRKPPNEVADLIGTGRLWVARGEFEILESDAKRHAKGVTMRLLVGELLMYVVSLTPLELAAKGSMRWAFRALFVPTDVQLTRLPVEELTRPSASTIEESAFFASHQPVFKPKPVPSVQEIAMQTPTMLAPPPMPNSVELDLEFDDVSDPLPTASVENSEKSALLAYLQSLAYPDDNSG